MKRKSPILSDAEVQIMSILWDQGKANVQQVCDLHEKKIAYTTIATMLGILEKKGYITHEVEGRTYIYRPLLSRDEVGNSTLRYVIKRFFKGSYQGLLANLAKSEDLSEENLKELKKIIKEAEQRDDK